MEAQKKWYLIQIYKDDDAYSYVSELLYSDLDKARIALEHSATFEGVTRLDVHEIVLGPVVQSFTVRQEHKTVEQVVATLLDTKPEEPTK